MNTYQHTPANIAVAFRLNFDAECVSGVYQSSSTNKWAAKDVKRRNHQFRVQSREWHETSDRGARFPVNRCLHYYRPKQETQFNLPSIVGGVANPQAWRLRQLNGRL
jgi:hypothetical protein